MDNVSMGLRLLPVANVAPVDLMPVKVALIKLDLIREQMGKAGSRGVIVHRIHGTVCTSV